MIRLCVFAVAAAAALGIDARAQTPMGTGWVYQGELHSSGQPTAGPADLRFRLYDAAAGGTQVGPQVDRPNVALAQGRFTVALDFGGAAFGPDARWLEIEVRSPAGSGSYVMLAPRQRVTGAPAAQFALVAGNATQLNGQPSSFYTSASNLTGTLPGGTLLGNYGNALNFSNAANSFTGSGAGLMSLNASNLASGTLLDARLSSNVALLNMAQTFSAGKTFAAAPSFTAAGSPFSVSSTTLVTNLNADRLDGLDSTAFLQSIPVPLTLIGTSGTHIIRGENAATDLGATGVYGAATATTGFGLTVGGQFVSAGALGRGVYGAATHASGATFGVLGQSVSTSGRGVYGEATATIGETSGVYGLADSSNGTGVFGLANAASGVNYGGRFESSSTGGRGVYGWARAASGFTNGGRFESDSTDGTGVYGWARATSGDTYGVLGRITSSSSNAYGVLALGRLGATGVKSFRIDHPGDPESKYLLHYSTESPEVLNAYSGTIVLDGTGAAVVALPHYFASINRDPRYTLTAVGAPMPMLHVSEKINAGDLAAGAAAGPGEAVPPCSFRIGGGVPGGEVSWRIEAVRNDRWMQNHGAPVEVEKQVLERGTYQHPEFYGQPIERGIGFEAADTVAEVERATGAPRP